MNNLNDIYLEDSYVLAIHEISPPELVCLLVLLPGHPLYSSPLPGEAHCYKDGKICFPNGVGFKWIEKIESRSIDIDGSEDLGNIYSIEIGGGITDVVGSFGRFHIEGEDVSVVFN